MSQSVAQLSSHRFKHPEIAVNSFYMPQNRHQFNANCLDFVPMSLNSSPLIAIQFDVSQFASNCQQESQSYPKSSASVSIS